MLFAGVAPKACPVLGSAAEGAAGAAPGVPPLEPRGAARPGVARPPSGGVARPPQHAGHHAPGAGPRPGGDEPVEEQARRHGMLRPGGAGLEPL